MQTSTFNRRDFFSAAGGAGLSALTPWISERHFVDDTNIINVRTFGAKGDGQTEDTQAIQSALDAAAKIQGTVFIPQGTYLTQELQVPAGIGIHGLPAWSYRDGQGTILRLKAGPSKCLLNLTGAFGAFLFGLCLQGSNLPGGIHGILIDKPDYGRQEDTPRIDTCRVERFSGDGIRLERIWCFCVRHSHCFANQGTGLRVRGWDGFILDNWFSGNGGAGYGSYDENASNTITGNRIEWNKGGGIVIMGGNHYNITGNYIDRSGRCGLSILPRGTQHSHTLAITGNVIYRSGKPDWGYGDPYDNAHVRLEHTKGLTFTANAMNSGRDDGGQGTYSPDYGLVLRKLECSVIKDNVFFNGMLKQMLVDLGDHGPDVIIKDNVGSLRMI